ncbi:MAG: nucleotidyltransferase domain-containing protein [Verrucomicrobia bacterium]|nr:nucleotidyltransferase domain-containing protein [Verrucomicrobiota bacterium]
MKIRSADAQQLRALGVEVLYLFGSQAQGLAGAGSDVDIGVLMAGELPAAQRLQTARRIEQLIEPSLGELGRRDLDIVFLNQCPMTLRRAVAFEGQVLFERTANSAADFRYRVMLESADFQPKLEMMQHATLEAFARS